MSITKYKVGDKVKLKRGRYAGKVGQIFAIEPYRLYGRRTFKVVGPNWFDICVSYEMELLTQNKPEEPKKVDSKAKKLVFEFDRENFKQLGFDDASKIERLADKIEVDDVIVKNRHGETGVKEEKREAKLSFEDGTSGSIKMTLSDAKTMYKAGGTLRNLALKAFTEEELNPKPKVPHTWEEYKNDFYPFESHMHYTPEFAHGFRKDDCDALIAYGRLIRLRRAWIKDWEPDYVNNTYGDHWVIEYDMKPKYEEEGKGPKVVNWGFMYRIIPLTFPTKEMATEFINCFGDLLEKAKGLY